MTEKKELWRVAREAWHELAYGMRDQAIWQHVVDAISKELLRDDEPVAIVDESDEGFFAGVIPTSEGITVKRGDKLYLRPAPKVPEGWQLVPKEPLIGINYEIGLWSRRNHEAMLEDQSAAAPKGEE